ncbi:hypothetical protein HMPREF2990_07310 [Corynebacterium sp. HMSC071B10]|nr:hypothetical protein HMPREF2990_07310 [Corynebacterium sp. HMSC071B10]
MSVAAAALSFALVAPFAQPIAAPQSAAVAYAGTPAEAGQPNDAGNGVKYPGEINGVYQSVVDEQRYTFTPGEPKVEGAIAADAPQGTNESIEGYVIHQRDGDLSVYPGARDPWKPIPMAGVRVYAQWTEKGGIVSPVYTGVTREDGSYTINMKPFTNAKGEVVKFDADPNNPQYEKIRVWVDNPDTDNFTQLYGYNFGHMGPNANTVDTPGGMGWFVGSDRVTNVRFAFGEKTRHDIMHRDKADQNPVVGNGPGQIKGNLFWHLYQTAGAFTPSLMNQMNGADVPATGMKVFASYLSDYAVNEINEKAANDLGFDEIRGRGWTNRNETALQNWIKRKMAEEGKDKWIAETAEATVGSDGNYTLQFKGSFGRNTGVTNNVDRGYDDGALIYTDLARNNGDEVTFPDGSKHNAYNLFGQVAPSPDYGSWLKNITGRGGENLPKHVNWDWLFFSTEETVGLGQFTPFHNNSFLPRSQYVFNGEGKWAGGMVYGAAEHYLAENRHVLYSDYIVFDVLEYDTRDNPAKPGATVQTKTAGLPTQWNEGLQYQIEWVNQETGEVVHTCDPVAPEPNGTIPSCQLDTTGVESTTTFTAYLYAVSKDKAERGQAVAADAFTVLVGWQPLYGATQARPREVARSNAPAFDNTETDAVETLSAEELKAEDENKEPTKFALPDTFEYPEGFTEDDIKVDPETGVVSVTFPADAANKDSLEVPVQVTYKDGTVATGIAPFVVESTERHSDKLEPEYKPGNGQPGEDATVDAPKFKETDENGKPTGNPGDKPDGTKFTKDDSKTPTYTDEEGNQKDLPENDVKVDENTGEITVTVPTDAHPDTEITVPVVVTYPDDSVDKVDATVKVGDPDPTNAEELDPEYKDESGKPGDKVEVDKPVFKDKDGNEVTPPEGTTFEKGEGAPEGVTVNEDGSITVDVPEDAKSGTEIEVPVVVTYPDGTTDEVETTVTVEQPDTTAPTIDPVAPGDRVITGKDDRPNTSISVTIPGVDTPIATTTDENGNWKVEVPSNVELKPGTKITVTDEVGNSSQTTVRSLEVAEKQNNEYDPSYAVTWGRAGQNVTSVKPVFTRNLSGFSFKRQPAPQGVKYALGAGAPAGAKIDAEGRVTVQLPASQAEMAPVPVVVTYADGTADTTAAEFKFRQRPLSETIDIEYHQGVMAAPGETVQVNHLENDLPEGTEFMLAPSQDFQGWFVHVDPETGVVSATAPENGGADSLKVIVKVSYLDGSEQEVPVGVRKKPNPATSQYQPKYENALVSKQTAHQAPQLVGLPQGTKFSIANDGGLDVQVNERTGNLSVQARPDSMPAASHQVTVRVQYPDNTSELVTVTFTVDSLARTNTTTWKTMEVPVKGIADESQKNPAPKHTHFAIAEDFAKPGWAVEVDPTTGKLTVAADKTVRVGEAAEIPVVLTLPDSSQRVVMVKAVAAAETPTCNTAGSSAFGSSSQGSSDECVAGSSESRFGIIGIIIGVLTLIGGAGAALFLNQDTVRDILRQNGINI